MLMQDEEKLPQFLCVGGAKCGTTSLYEYLKQHPEIYLSDQKELHYFSYPELSNLSQGPGMKHVLNGLIQTEASYRRQFSGAHSSQHCGDISPSYLIYPEAIPRIKALLGKPRIIIMLRDPVDRVFSQYMHLKRAAREPLDFEAALQAEDERVAACWGDMWHYKRSGFYYEAVKAYIDAFGRESVLIILSDEMRNDVDHTLKRVFDFLSVAATDAIDTTEEFNRSGLPKFKYLARLLDASFVATLAKKILPRKLGAMLKRRVQSINTGHKEVLNPRMKLLLRDVFHDDITKLEGLIGYSTGWNEK